MAVAAQWSLDATVGSALSISRGVIHAATSDNIQPLAILACEKFGATIPMCHETCRKVETDVLPTGPPATIAFLQGVVGYSRNDSATQLGRSASGVRFLGLAAALVTTMGPFESANAISLLLESAASDTTLLPTVRQLKDLMVAMEGRLFRARFTDSVLGWHKLMLCHQSSLDENRPNNLRLASLVPSAQAIETLVDAFRRLYRIGESTVSKVTIHTTYYSSWVIAFTQWCLGAPPSVYLDDGSPIIEQPNLGVDVVLNLEEIFRNDRTFLVTVYHNIGNPEELISRHPEQPSHWSGMTTIENYGQWLLATYNMDRGEAFNAIQECLPYAAKRYLKTCRFRSDNREVPDDSTSMQALHSAEEFRAIPFGSDNTVADVLFRMLHGGRGATAPKANFGLQDLGDDMRIIDLPLVKLYLDSLKTTCTCQMCHPDSSAVVWETCDLDTFIYHASLFLCDALALSLFHLSENLLVYVNPRRGPALCEEFHRTITDTFDHSSVTTGHPTIQELAHWALMLVGHDVESEMSKSKWAMSCFKGQAVYPTIFESNQIRKRGFLALSWQSGMLSYQGERYECVRSEATGDGALKYAHPSQANSIPDSLRCLNLYPELNLRWRIKTGDGFLDLGAYLDGLGNERLLNPFEALLVLADSHIVERCCHDRDRELDRAEPSYSYSSPEFPREPASYDLDCDNTYVVAVDGANDLRFYSLARVKRGNGPVVVRVNACLGCSLDVCRWVGRSPILIL